MKQGYPIGNTLEMLFKNKNVIIFRLGTLFGLSDLFSRIRMDLVVNTLCAKAFFEKKIKSCLLPSCA